MDSIIRQREKLKENNLDLDVWFSSTVSHLQNTPEVDITLIANFISLQYDYKNALVLNDNIKINTDNLFKEKARQFLNEVVEIIEKMNNQAIPKNNEIKERKKLIKFSNKNYIIDQNLFWAVIAILVSGSFYFGFHFGNNKFDKDKLDYYQNMKKLEIEIVKKDSLIFNYKLKSEIKKDSL